ncbi:hypothetical protein [Singulisphaera sp. PoT]|uniref:hypothetical protein n=1 Tax=Singulisphaera sp. PoT TaxID=3411797 RepID=UPI003BF58F37
MWVTTSIGLSLLLILSSADPAAAPKAETLTLAGEVCELGPALQNLRLPFDSEPIAKQVVLKTSDKALHPLISDEASRALFLDRRLRDRRAELKVRRYPGLPYLQVLTIQVDFDGKLGIPEYYCEVCTISVRSPQTCPCCQGDMVLRRRPDSR